MKRLTLTFRVRDIKNYESNNDKEFEFDNDIRDIIGKIIDIVDIQSDTILLGEECYWIEYSANEITEEQQEKINDAIEELISIEEITVNEI